MAVERFGEALRVLALAVHAQADGGQAAIEHPAFIGRQNVAEHVAAAADFLNGVAGLGERDAGQHVAEASQILRGGVKDDIGTELQGVLKDGPQEGVVHHDDGFGGMAGRGVCRAFDIGHGHGGIGGRFEEDDAAVRGGADGFVEGGGIATADGNPAHAEGSQEAVDEAGGAAVKGRGVDDGTGGAGEGEAGSHDGRHTGIEDRGVRGTGFEGHNLVFQDLGIGVREAGVNQVGAFAFGGFDFAGSNGESVFRGFGTFEDVGGTAEDRGARGSEGKLGVEAPGQHRSPRADSAMAVIAIGHYVLPLRV